MIPESFYRLLPRPSSLRCGRALVVRVFGLLLALSIPAIAQQGHVTYWPLKPTGSMQVAKWTVANSGSNFSITDPTGATATVAKAGAVTQSVTVFALPAKSAVLACLVKTDTAFLGTTTLTATVGITGTLTACIATPFDLKAAVSNTNFSVALPTTPVVSWAGTNLILALTATIDNISSISAGQVEIQLIYTVLI